MTKVSGKRQDDRCGGKAEEGSSMWHAEGSHVTSCHCQEESQNNESGNQGQATLW